MGGKGAPVVNHVAVGKARTNFDYGGRISLTL